MNKKITFDSYSTKRVSYILTTKNRARFLDEALVNYGRLIKQDDELIIIDGGSTDGTDKVIKKYADLVNIFVSEPDIDMTHALNKGMLLAKGKYIKNLTDDDEIYPRAMEKAISVLEKHPEVDILVCGGTKQRGSSYSIVYLPKGVNYGERVEDVVEYGACGVGFIFRRNSLAISGLIPVGPSGDVNFIMACICKRLSVKFCRINLFNHPIYTHSVVVTQGREHQKDFDKTISKYLPQKTYLKYRLVRAWNSWPRYTEKLYKEIPMTKVMFWPVRILLAKMNRRKIEKIRHSISTDLNSLISNKKYKWDGGFS